VAETVTVADAVAEGVAVALVVIAAVGVMVSLAVGVVIGLRVGVGAELVTLAVGGSVRLAVGATVTEGVADWVGPVGVGDVAVSNGIEAGLEDGDRSREVVRVGLSVAVGASLVWFPDGSFFSGTGSPAGDGVPVGSGCRPPGPMCCGAGGLGVGAGGGAGTPTVAMGVAPLEGASVAPGIVADLGDGVVPA
jgi:hypothetical protein